MAATKWLVFDPRGYDGGKVLLNNFSNDPDCNFFNDANLENSYVNKSDISNFGVNGLFSVMHINRKSLLQKCTQLSNLTRQI